MASIPSGIIFDILSQLPVKSLARFKALNKLCHSFITKPQFIRTHFKNGVNRANNSNLCLLLSHEEHRNLNSTVHFLTVTDIDEVPVLEYSADVPAHFGGYNVLPSCNGLVCFHSFHGGVHVCNPSTKDIVRLPDSDADGFRPFSYGFGFDEMSGKYKVIQFLYPGKTQMYFLFSRKTQIYFRIELFTMGDNSWKTIGYRPGFGLRRPPVFAGGFFYWITTCHPLYSSSLLIASFDIRNEIFKDISPPQGIRFSINNCLKVYLVELRADLCLVNLDSVGKRMDIWILKRNVAEKKENWVRATIVHQSEDLGLTRPVAFNGEEILLHGYIRGLGHLHSYNLQTSSFRQLEIKGDPTEYFHASHHVESLFPININSCDNM